MKENGGEIFSFSMFGKFNSMERNNTYNLFLIICCSPILLY
jgi:hypothetical protein